MSFTHIKEVIEKKRIHLATASAILADKSILEMIYSPSERRSAFAVWKEGEWTIETEVKTDLGKYLVPYSPQNNLIKNGVVLFPSEPHEYGTEKELILEIQRFIHSYLDLSGLYEKIGTYYVLLSWLYDGFNELPYLRARGDLGSGKTRFLKVIGSLCYKPIFATGASTVSPLFRILDAMRGTLIIDEGDFRMSDEKAEIVKILNNGNAKGFPVLRSEVTNKHEYDPRAYAVFGPKIISTRGYFEDRALESRCITEEMGQQPLRRDIPITLPVTFNDEALTIRNKLLLFRFKHFPPPAIDEALIDRTLEPRMNQIFAPLVSIIKDEETRRELQELARAYNSDNIAERGMDSEAQVLEVIRNLSLSDNSQLSVKDITQGFCEKYESEYQRKITPKWIGNVIRKRLQIKTQKSHGVFIIPFSELSRLERLYEKYGIGSATGETAE